MKIKAFSHFVSLLGETEESKWSTNAQTALHDVNHPVNCTTAKLLLCNTAVRKFQGTGSRLFFLGRCLAEGLNSGRAVVLTNDLPSSLDMLEPFEAWGSCTLEHAKMNTAHKRILRYSPMDEPSLEKAPSEAPGAGLLVPRQFSSKGYWWWKAQEITYALRPKLSTLDTWRQSTRSMGWTLDQQVAVFQVRRTDKTDGCAKHYGSKSPVKCKAEASAPKLEDFLSELNFFAKRSEDWQKKVAVVTDDIHIEREIMELEPKERRMFFKVLPAPKRVADKEGKGGVFRGRALKDALDILTMAHGDPLIFTYSSGFGAVALQLKQTRENFCSNWASLDWGKKEWPQVGAIGDGGVRGVKFNSTHASKLCYGSCSLCHPESRRHRACVVHFMRSSARARNRVANVRSICSCKRS